MTFANQTGSSDLFHIERHTYLIMPLPFNLNPIQRFVPTGNAFPPKN